MTVQPFDYAAIVRAIARAGGPAEVARIVGGDPRKQAIADQIDATVAKAPPLTAEQRAAVASMFRAPAPGATAPRLRGGGGS